MGDREDALKSLRGLQRYELSPHGTLFVKRPHGKPPSWARFFDGQVGPEVFGKAKSTGAVLLVTVESRHFAVLFGIGRHFLHPLAIEQRFGLLVTLNTVNPRKIRSIDKASLDRQGMQSRTQASRDATAREFGLDFDADLIKAVAGTPAGGLPGEAIAGFDALHINTRVNLDELRARVGDYLKLSREKTYRKEFAWIDQVREVRDAALTERLTVALVEGLKSQEPL